jgi:hypothetical protein
MKAIPKTAIDHKEGPSRHREGFPRLGALGKDSKALTDALGLLDSAIPVDFQKQSDRVDAWSMRSG